MRFCDFSFTCGYSKDVIHSKIQRLNEALNIWPASFSLRTSFCKWNYKVAYWYTVQFYGWERSTIGVKPRVARVSVTHSGRGSLAALDFCLSKRSKSLCRQALWNFWYFVSCVEFLDPQVVRNIKQILGLRGVSLHMAPSFSLSFPASILGTELSHKS